MPNPPHRQHFIQQFWQKRFSHNGTNVVWAYDVERHRVEERSTKSLMQIYDLYTEDPSGAVDTSLETGELAEIDQNGSDAFERVLDHEDRRCAPSGPFHAIAPRRHTRTMAPWSERRHNA